MAEELQMRVTTAYERRKLISLLEEYRDENPELKTQNEESFMEDYSDPDAYTWGALKSQLDLRDEAGKGSSGFESFVESLGANGDRLVAFEKLLPEANYMSPVYSILRIAVHVLSSGEQENRVEMFLVPLVDIMEQVYLASRTAEAAEGLECRTEVQSKIIEFYGAVIRACTDVFGSFLKHSRGASCTCHDSADQAPLASVQEVKKAQEAIATGVLGCVHRQSSRLENGGRCIPPFTMCGPVALSEDCADTHEDKQLGPQQGAEEQSTDTDGYDAALHAGREKIYSAFYTLFQAHPEVDGLLEFATNESEGSVSHGTGETFTETPSTDDDVGHGGITVDDYEWDCYILPREDTDNYRAPAANDHAGLHSDPFTPTNYYGRLECRFPYSARQDDVDLDVVGGNIGIPRCRDPHPLPTSSKDSRPTPKGSRVLGLYRLTQALQRGLRNATSLPPQDQNVTTARRIESTLALLNYAPHIPESNVIAMIKHKDTFEEHEQDTLTFVRMSEKLRTWMVECKASRALLINGQFPAANATTTISPLSVLCAQIAHMYSAVIASTVVLSYFCGVRTREDPASAGPRDMMRSLLSQLLAVYAEHRFEVEGSFDKEKLEKRIAIGELTPLCAVFDALVLQLPRDTVVCCIIDSISVFETREHEAALERCWNRFFKLVGNKKSGIIFKLFVTAPGDSSCKPKGQAEVLNVLEETQGGRHGEFVRMCLGQGRY